MDIGRGRCCIVSCWSIYGSQAGWLDSRYVYRLLERRGCELQSHFPYEHNSFRRMYMRKYKLEMFKANDCDLFVRQYPAVIIPFTHVDSAKDLPYESFEPLSDDDVKVQAQCKRHAHQALACKQPSPTFSSP